MIGMKDIKKKMKKMNLQNVAIFIIVVGIVYYLFTNQKEGIRDTRHNRVVNLLLTLIDKINVYLKKDEADKEQITSLGMEAHHIDEMESVDHRLNPIAKMIHQDVCHDLLRLHYSIDAILKMEDNNQKLDELKKDIQQTPDKNFKPSSKEKMIKLIDILQKRPQVN